jgi:hypothetical protein
LEINSQGRAYLFFQTEKPSRENGKTLKLLAMARSAILKGMCIMERSKTSRNMEKVTSTSQMAASTKASSWKG